jgi:hypothetical protein
MTAATITRLTRTGFEAVPVMKERAIELSLFGNGDMTVSAALKSYLKELDAEARRHGVTAVHVELGELFFSQLVVPASHCRVALDRGLAPSGRELPGGVQDPPGARLAASQPRGHSPPGAPRGDRRLIAAVRLALGIGR